MHYLGDPGRGSVWEETIINCPPHIRLLAMSATIANAHDLGGWISQVCLVWQGLVPRRLGSVTFAAGPQHAAADHCKLGPLPANRMHLR